MIIPPGNDDGDLLVWDGTAWVPRPQLANGQAVLANDTTVVGGAPITPLLSFNIATTGKPLMVGFSASGRANNSIGAWRECTFQIRIDGSLVVGSVVSGYQQSAAPTSSSCSATRIITPAVGNHVITLDAVLLQAGPAGWEMFPVSRPNSDHCILRANELE